MSNFVRVRLEPLGQVLEIERGKHLQDTLSAYGVEFPCGGNATCKGCRVKLLSGRIPPTPDEEQVLSPDEISNGWRLGCRLQANEDLVVEVEQWETVILADNSVFHFVPREGIGVAVDLGTTTVVAQSVDLATGRVLRVSSAVNPQVAYGSDVMSRVEYAIRNGGRNKLTQLIRDKIGEMVFELAMHGRPADTPREIIIVGNTVMHHLFCGIDVEPLAHVPFEPSRDGLEVFRAGNLGWSFVGDATVRFLPCLGGFVGSDILAGLLATKLPYSDEFVGLVDLGTNGEIVFGDRRRMICASTAAGPAFEGGRISMGMRAATGAISGVSLQGGRLECHVIGNGSPRGICGSGLVDAVAVGLELGRLGPDGRFQGGEKTWTLIPPVTLTQRDIRELQLAKAAIAAGIRIVLKRLGSKPADVTRVYLAGAFGNYVNRWSARRIGLFDFPLEIVRPAGNTALHGAKIAFFREEDPEGDFRELRNRIEHISLAADPEFQKIFVEEMQFPTFI